MLVNRVLRVICYSAGVMLVTVGVVVSIAIYKFGHNPNTNPGSLILIGAAFMMIGALGRD